MSESDDSTDHRVRRLRVCIVAPSLDILGGQSIVADRLMEQLRRDDSLSVSFVPHNPRLPGPFRVLQRIKYVRTVVTSVAYLASLLRKLPRQDVIHIFSASYWSFLLAPAPAVLIGRLFRKRVVLNYHSGEALDHLTKWPVSTRAILRRATLIVVPSQYLADVFSKFGYHAAVVSNFVDIAAFRYRIRSSLRPVFLANRNFAPHYNVACVLRAFALIQKTLPDARLIIAGDGSQRRQLEELARDLGLASVEFRGQVSPEAMRAMYDEADIYLNSPDIDNMPMSIIESYAAGIPVVTTRAGGIPYILAHEETGLLVECNDHDAIAAAALRLLSDPALAVALTRTARAQALERYTWAAVHPRWREVYGVT